jgi:hypothetical protein
MDRIARCRVTRTATSDIDIRQATIETDSPRKEIARTISCWRGLSARNEPVEENLLDLPDSFGANGGGLWRVYVRKCDDGSFEAVHHRLIGIASSEDRSPPPRITCQGMRRILVMLESVRRCVSGES